jgi:hypothetical protein
VIDAGPAARAEARAIEQLWNSGDYDEAMTRLHNLGNVADPARVMVGFNWRTPIPSPAHPDWGGNVEISPRDSIQTYVLDYHNSDGRLVAGVTRADSGYTALSFYLSTDSGSNWAETYTGYWSSGTVITDLTGRCNGSYMYLAYVNPSFPESLYVERFRTLDGSHASFVSGNVIVAAVGVPPGDTIVQAVLTSWDDVTPGLAIYAFAGTRRGNICGAWSDSGAVTWVPYDMSSLAGTYSGGLAATMNPGYANRYIFLSYYSVPFAASYYPSVAWVKEGHDSIVGGGAFNFPSPSIANTSITARNDSAILTYEHGNAAGLHYPRTFQTSDGGETWTLSYLPGDTTLYREQPDICARRTSDVGAVYRERSANGARHIAFTSSNTIGGTWATPESVSDYLPWAIWGPQVCPLGPGVFGVAYVSYPGGNLWFNRSNFANGVAEPVARAKPVAALRALPLPGGARLEFVNPAAGEIRLRVYDVNGCLIHQETRYADGGVQNWSYTAPASGVYFATVSRKQPIGSAKFATVK